MRKISLRAWLLVGLSALLQICSFPIAGQIPVWRCLLAWVALVPLLLALVTPSETGAPLTPRQGALVGYVCGVLWYLGNCGWIYQTMYLYGGLPKPVAFGILVLFTLYLGLYHALFGFLFAVVHRSRLSSVGAVVLAPVLWVTVELARARVTGFPWDLLGYTQVDNLWLTRLAPVAGVMAISFVVAAGNSLFTLPWVLRGRQRWLMPISAALAICALAIAGRPRVSQAAAPEIALMLQENLQVGSAARFEPPLSNAQELAAFTTATLHPLVPEGFAYSRVGPASAAGTSLHPTVVVWPEAPADFHSSDSAFRTAMTQLARQVDAPLVIGSLGFDVAPDSEHGYYLYDSASLFDRSGNYQGRYDKVHLVPWG